LPALRVSRVVAYTRLLRACCCALPPRTWHSSEAPVLGASAWRALADRLAPNQSWRVTSRRNVGTQMHRGICRCGVESNGKHTSFLLSTGDIRRQVVFRGQ
jgi:hypothetical protein